MRIIINGINVFFVICIIFITFFVLKYSIVPADSGYYLAISRDFYGGKAFFTEIKTSYTPLAIVLYGLPFLWSEKTTYFDHQIIAIFIDFFCAFIFYRISCKISSEKYLNVFYSLFFLLLIYFLDATEIILEPVSVLFQLIAVLFYIKNRKNEKYRNLIFCGVAVALSFLSKQYGLFILIPLFIDLLFQKGFIKKIGGILMGFLFPLLFVSFYLLMNGENFKGIFLNLVGKGAYLDIGNGTGAEYHVADLLASFKKYILICLPAILLLILMLIALIQKKMTVENWFYLLMLPCSSLVLIFAYYSHYYIYIVAFTLLPLVYFLNLVDHKFFKIVGIFLVLVSSSRILRDFYSFRNKRIQLHSEQLEVAKKLNNIVPKKSAVYFDGFSSSYLYLCDFESIDDQKLSYSFYPLFKKQTIINALDQSNEYLIINEASAKYYLELKNTCDREELALKKDTILIYKKQ